MNPNPVLARSDEWVVTKWRDGFAFQWNGPQGEHPAEVEGRPVNRHGRVTGMKCGEAAALAVSLGLRAVPGVQGGAYFRRDHAAAQAEQVRS